MSLAPDKQFDFAERAITQVITLASAVLALSVTFASKWGSTLRSDQKWLLRGSWILMAVSLLAGLLSLLALAGMAYGQDGDIARNALRVPWVVQLVAFTFGLGLLFWLGLTVL